MRFARIALGVGGAGVVAAASQIETVVVAYHEAGHAVLGRHYQLAGMRSDRLHGHIQVQPLLRYVTCVPRQTAQGTTYLGETKLAVRWRHMYMHTRWKHADELASERNVPVLPTSRLSIDGALAVEHTLLLARISYVLGGRAAEDQLWRGPARRADAELDSRKSVQRLIAHPGRASGDLRQANRLAPAISKGPGSGVSTEDVLDSAYSFAHQVVVQRWGQVQVLAGALIVLGTLNGHQCDQLFAEVHRAAETDERLGVLLHSLRRWPLLFGCVWGALQRATSVPAPKM